MENQNNTSKKEQYDLKKQEKQASQQKRQKTKKIKSILIWTIGIIAIIAAVFIMVKLANNASPDSDISIDSIAPTDQVKGNPDAKLVLTEYSDFQCPACAMYVPFVSQVVDEYGDKIAFVYRHFPLSSIHPHAEAAARAAEAAGEQNAFWPMHDILFDEQSQWSASSRPKKFFLEYAERLNLDLVQFESDYNSSKIKDKVETDRQSGLRARIDSTPTFFINGNKIQNPRNGDELKALLDAALNVLEIEETINATTDEVPATS